MQKWSYFSIGIMAGVILVLLTIVVMQNHEPRAYGDPFSPQGSSADGQGGNGLVMSTGAATNNMNDILWVIHGHKATRKAGGSEKDITAKEDRLTLCCYQVMQGGRKIKLVGARDISFDMELLEFENDKPSVKDIVDAIKKSMPKDSNPPKDEKK